MADNMTSKHPKTLLVIVAEAVLEKQLVRDLRTHGAQSWTVYDVRGSWREGAREGAWEADRTIEMKVICDSAVADAIASHVLQVYAPNFSVSMHFSAVDVLRPDRF
jgi:hypothetical protein